MVLAVTRLTKLACTLRVTKRTVMARGTHRLPASLEHGADVPGNWTQAAAGPY